MANPKIQTRIDPEKKEQIDDWMEAESVDSEADAVRKLVDRGLESASGDALAEQIRRLLFQLATVAAVLSVSSVLAFGSALIVQNDFLIYLFGLFSIFFIAAGVVSSSVLYFGRHPAVASIYARLQNDKATTRSGTKKGVS